MNVGLPSPVPFPCVRGRWGAEGNEPYEVEELHDGGVQKVGAREAVALKQGQSGREQVVLGLREGRGRD
jgi:hypothetical protein